MRSGLRAAGGRAASERPRRRSSGGVLAGRVRQAARPLCPGRFSGGRHDRVVSVARARPRAGHRCRSGVRPRARSAAGSCCSSSSGPGRSTTCSPTRSATRSTAIRSSTESPPRSRAPSRCCASGPGPPSSTCRLRSPARRSAIRSSPRPGGACSPNPTGRSRAHGASTTRASSPTRSTVSRPSTEGSSRVRTWRPGARRSSRPRPSTTAGSRCARPLRGGRAPQALQQLRLLEGFDVSALGEAELVHVLTEAAKLAFADRDANYGDVDVQLHHLLSTEYADARRALIGDEASAELRPGLGRLPQLVDAGSELGVGRADPRRHRSPGRGRSLREPDLGDAERRLAAELADDPGARLAARHPRADVLARGGPAVLARAAQTAAHDALAGSRSARRRAVARLRHARRRPAGAVGAARPRASCRPWARPAGGDRRARVAHRSPDLVVLSRAASSRGRWRSSPGSATRRSPTSAGAATTSPLQARGPSGGSARSPAQATSWWRPQMPAECRATPSPG